MKTSQMLSYHQVLELINQIDFKLPIIQKKLEEAYKYILGEDAYSDINMPPFDKSAMDGYACRKEDLNHVLRVIGVLHAGRSEKFSIGKKECVKIMTGAPVPEGADMVIIIENTEVVDEDHIRFTGASKKSNICSLGEDVMAGDQLLIKGSLLLPQHIAILASAGYSKVKLYAQPKVALLSTGSELVEPGRSPKGSQIRNSNAYNLLAQLKSMQIDAYFSGIIGDSKDEISRKLHELSERFDVVILTGGASVGEHDFVPETFEEMGLKLHFRKVAVQPGKPVSFASGKSRFCFGLSGNPVSSFLQFELLVKPFLYHIMGHKHTPSVQLAPLAKTISRKQADRLKFFPVRNNPQGAIEEIEFNGSAHMNGLSNADGFGLFPQGCYELASEDLIEVLQIH